VAEQRIEEEARSAAPPEAVWALVADITTWQRWGDWSQTTLERPASDESPEGLGAIRSLRRGRVNSREEVVTWEPNRRYGYRLLAGLPVRDYRAEVSLEPDGSGTRIRWSSRFHPRLGGTGWMWRIMLGRFIADTARRLARAAEEGPTRA
jgi:hypothetical protein